MLRIRGTGSSSNMGHRNNEGASSYVVILPPF